MILKETLRKKFFPALHRRWSKAVLLKLWPTDRYRVAINWSLGHIECKLE